MSKYILFDTETTGNKDDDKIIQLGFMVVETGKDVEVYDELNSTDVDIKIEAMEVHNITPNMLENKPLLKDTKGYQKICELNSSDNYLIAHNIKFDLDMIQKEGFANNMKLIDTLRCASHLYDDLSAHRLQYLRYKLDIYKDEENEAQKLGITIKAHDAIGDVLIMKLLLSRLVAKTKEKFEGIKNADIMNKLVELTQTPVHIKVFKFGKYKGELIQDIANSDIGYLRWMRDKLDLDEDMTYTLDFYL
jgi:DNA polymerase-3 subunit epsilon/exodeoxyribonuclease X